MKSAVRVEALVQCFLERELSRDIHSQLKGYLHHFDCVDADNDNRTVCKFYFAPEVGKNLINGFVRELAVILGVADSAALEEQCADGLWKVQYIVEVSCIYPANSSGRYTLRQTTVKSEPVCGEPVIVSRKQFDSFIDAQRGLAAVFSDYVQNNCETLIHADIRPRRAVVRYADGVTEVFEVEEVQ